MSGRHETRIGSIRLKNPVICAAGEHVMTAAGIRSRFEGLPCSTSRVMRTANTISTDMAPT